MIPLSLNSYCSQTLQTAFSQEMPNGALQLFTTKLIYNQIKFDKRNGRQSTCKGNEAMWVQMKQQLLSQSNIFVAAFRNRLRIWHIADNRLDLKSTSYKKELWPKNKVQIIEIGLSQQILAPSHRNVRTDATDKEMKWASVRYRSPANLNSYGSLLTPRLFLFLLQTL